MALSIPAILTGAGGGFLVGGPAGALVGAIGGGIIGRRPAIEPVNTPVGPGVIVNDDSIVPTIDPTTIPPATQAAATLVNQLTNTPDAIDYQPYPPDYLWNQSDALSGYGAYGATTWEQLKANLPLTAIGVVGAAIFALMYFSAPKRR